MDDSLYEDLSPARRSVVPGKGFFRDERGPDPTDDLETADAVVIADGDADGLGCAALVREAHGHPLPETLDYEAFEAPDGGVVLVPAAPHSLAASLATVAARAPPDAPIYVCDLCPDDAGDLAALPALVGDGHRAVDAFPEGVADLDADVDPDDLPDPRTTESGDAAGGDAAGTVDRRVRWFDHHQWEPALAEQVRAAGVELVVGASDEECSTDVTRRSLGLDGFEELARVTRDHDLWIREDSRSEDLADYAHWSSAELYVATVRTHGPDFPESAREFLAERRRQKEALVRKAIERAEFRTVAGVTVGVTYGRCSQNEVAEALREDGAHAAVVVKPSGSASLRGTDAFARCHEVARRLGGGGHPKAAGCKPDVYDDVLDYAHHWTTRGATARRVILDAFEAVVVDSDGAVAAATVAEATVEGDGSLEGTDGGAPAAADADADATD